MKTVTQIIVCMLLLLVEVRDVITASIEECESVCYGRPEELSETRTWCRSATPTEFHYRACVVGGLDALHNSCVPMCMEAKRRVAPSQKYKRCLYIYGEVEWASSMRSCKKGYDHTLRNIKRLVVHHFPTSQGHWKKRVDRLVNYLASRNFANNVFDVKARNSSGNRGPGAVQSDYCSSKEENRVMNAFTKASQSVAYIVTSSGTGSGFLWDNKGHIITNYHVIKLSVSKSKSPVIKVKLQGRSFRSARVVGYRAKHDLAVLRISSKNLPVPIDIGATEVKVGQTALVIGYPSGLSTATLTTGVVSAVADVADGEVIIRGCILSDAVANPGNSGGPLLDSHGRLIGVIFAREESSAALGMSIPLDTAMNVAGTIIQTGY